MNNSDKAIQHIKKELDSILDSQFANQGLKNIPESIMIPNDTKFPFEYESHRGKWIVEECGKALFIPYSSVKEINIEIKVKDENL